jgi:hypothetical protein
MLDAAQSKDMLADMINVGIEALLGDDVDTIRAQCETHLGYAGNNYLPFLLPLFASHRKLFLDVLEFLHPTSTHVETALKQAIAFVLRYRQTRAPRLPVRGEEGGPEARLELSWVPPR